jgi:hypothetical protein
MYPQYNNNNDKNDDDDDDNKTRKKVIKAGVFTPISCMWSRKCFSLSLSNLSLYPVLK